MTMENLTRIENKRTNISFLELKIEPWIIPPLTMPDTKGHLSSQQLHLGLASVHHKSAGGHAGNGQAGQIQGAHGWLAAGGSPTVLRCDAAGCGCARQESGRSSHGGSSGCSSNGHGFGCLPGTDDGTSLNHGTRPNVSCNLLKPQLPTSSLKGGSGNFTWLGKRYETQYRNHP